MTGSGRLDSSIANHISKPPIAFNTSTSPPATPTYRGVQAVEWLVQPWPVILLTHHEAPHNKLYKTIEQISNSKFIWEHFGLRSPGFFAEMDKMNVSKAVTELVNEIQRLMFTSETPVAISEDTTKFMSVMSAFNNYEKSVKHTISNRVL